MIRIPTDTGWFLMGHQDHAQLAGQFASRWRNELFIPPDPIEDILVAVSRHDDAWAERDTMPLITRSGLPSAFSAELVGSYSAFEEIDLEDYLRVRGNATEAVAQLNPYAAIIVSKHTVNLLTEQADLSTLNDEQRKLHLDFIEGQLNRQSELAQIVSQDEVKALYTTHNRLQLAFEFLQACDSLSLIVCVDFPESINLRHTHPATTGERKKITCTPLKKDLYSLSPYPFDTNDIEFELPTRYVEGIRFHSNEAFQEAFFSAPVVKRTIRFVA